MSRLPVCFFNLMLFLILPSTGISQTIRDGNSKLIVRINGGEIRDSNSRKIGTIYSDGVVRNSSGEKLGTIQDDKVVDDNGATVFKYDSGTVRDKNGRLIYRIAHGDIRSSSNKLMFKFEGIDESYLIGYLCFFYNF